MNRYVWSVLVLLMCCTTQAQTMPYRVVGYYAAWHLYEEPDFLTRLPIEKLTHINYAFVNVSPEGECVLGDPAADVAFRYPSDLSDPRTDTTGAPLAGNLNQLLRLREAKPTLKLILSVGGWIWSDHFSDAALTAPARQRFAQSCVALVERYAFDGLDIDWEYPVSRDDKQFPSRAEDKQNYTLLLAEVRAQLDILSAALGKPLFLSIAAPAGAYYGDNIEIAKIHASLDWINLMTYDFSVEGLTMHHAPLFASAEAPPEFAAHNVVSAVAYYHAKGVPADKIVVGVPFYGYEWTEVPPGSQGLFQPYDTMRQISYSEIMETFADNIPLVDEQAQASWLYDAASQRMVSYDTPQSIAAKAAFVRDNGLGGMMIWELSQDKAEGVLLDTLWTTLMKP